MRMLLGCALALGLVVSATARADDKDNAKKLVGKWEPTMAKEGFKSTTEFTADGKIIISGSRGEGKDFKVEGTYKLDGKKLSWTIKAKDKERTEETTVDKLTDDELAITDSKGNKREYKRAKGSGKDK